MPALTALLTLASCAVSNCNDNPLLRTALVPCIFTVVLVVLLALIARRIRG